MWAVIWPNDGNWDRHYNLKLDSLKELQTILDHPTTVFQYSCCIESPLSVAELRAPEPSRVRIGAEWHLPNCGLS